MIPIEGGSSSSVEQDGSLIGERPPEEYQQVLQKLSQIANNKLRIPSPDPNQAANVIRHFKGDGDLRLDPALHDAFDRPQYQAPASEHVESSIAGINNENAAESELTHTSKPEPGLTAEEEAEKAKLEQVVPALFVDWWSLEQRRITADNQTSHALQLDQQKLADQLGTVFEQSELLQRSAALSGEAGTLFHTQRDKNGDLFELRWTQKAGIEVSRCLTLVYRGGTETSSTDDNELLRELGIDAAQGELSESEVDKRFVRLLLMIEATRRWHGDTAEKQQYYRALSHALGELQRQYPRTSDANDRQYMAIRIQKDNGAVADLIWDTSVNEIREELTYQAYVNELQAKQQSEVVGSGSSPATQEPTSTEAPTVRSPFEGLVSSDEFQNGLRQIIDSTTFSNDFQLTAAFRNNEAAVRAYMLSFDEARQQLEAGKLLEIPIRFANNDSYVMRIRAELTVDYQSRNGRREKIINVKQLKIASVMKSKAQ